MKKFIKIVTVILLSLFLFACDADSNQPKQEQPQQEEVVEETQEEETKQEEVVEEDTEEEKEESKEKTPKEEMKYWIVFFNPDGRELQRTAEKYGTTPKYESEEPVYWDADYWYNFVGWTDKDGNDITDFKPITGNKYIYAKYEIGGMIEQESAQTEQQTMVTVFFSLPGSDSGYVVISPSTDRIDSIQVPIGSTFSYDSTSFTINNVVYTFYNVSGSYAGTTIDPIDGVKDGKIISDVSISANFEPA